MVTDMFDLSGKTAVITGGGGVLCKSMACELASRGANVAILDLREEAAQAAANEITQVGGKAIGVGCNVLEKTSLEAACAEVIAEFGSVDILINGAGGNNPGNYILRELQNGRPERGAEGFKTFLRSRPGRRAVCVQPELHRHAAAISSLRASDGGTAAVE